MAEPRPASSVAVALKLTELDEETDALAGEFNVTEGAVASIVCVKIVPLVPSPPPVWPAATLTAPLDVLDTK